MHRPGRDAQVKLTVINKAQSMVKTVVCAFFVTKRFKIFNSVLSSKGALFAVASVLVIPLSMLLYVLNPSVTPAQAATADTLNFQGRLLTSTGSLVPDGTYNVEFNLYNVATLGSSLWTEDRLNTNTQGVTVRNGYFSVYLGELDPFGALNWDQDMYLGMTIRGTGSCAWGSCTPADSEMTPRFKLTSVPYAFTAKQLLATDSGFKSTLGFTTPTQNNTITLPDESGDVCLTSGNCAGVGGTGDVLQGGNSFTANMLIGTNDNYSLTLETNNTAALTVSTSQLIRFNAYNCSALANGGALTTDASGNVICSDDDGGGAAPSLQSAYDNGNSILTTDARDISFTLANTTTDSNFIANIATGSTSKIAFQLNGTDLLRIDSAGIDLIDVDVADFTGATVTFDAGEIVETEIAQNTLDDSEIQDNSLTAGSLATNSVAADEIAANAVGSSELASSGVTLGAYGDAANVATFTVDTDGRLTVAGSTAIAINASAINAGTLGYARGGTGSTSYTTNGVLYAGASGLQSTAVGATNQCLLGNTGSAPTWGSCYAGGSGFSSITLAGSSGTPQTISEGDTITIAAGSNLTSTAGATDTVTLAVVTNPTFTGIVTSRSNFTAETAVATEDQIILQAAAGGAARFSGTITNADLTVARTYTLPNLSGTFALTSNNQTFSSTQTFSGTLAVSGTTSLTGTTITLGDAVTDGVTINAALLGTNALIFDGSTNDTNEITLAVTNPGADFTITLPAETGTICTTGSVCAGYQASGSYLTAEADTLASVTGRGATTAVASSFTTSISTPLITQAGALNIRTTGANALTLGTNTTTRLTIDSAGLATFTNNVTAGDGTATWAYSAASGSNYGFSAWGRNATSTSILGGSVTGDTFWRFTADAAGTLAWGAGTIAQDTNLFRNAANVLRTNDSLTVDLDVAVNGGDLTTTATTFNLLNTTATTVNAFGAATTLNLGASTGTSTVNNSLAVNGNTTLGNATSDTITFTGRVNTDILPSADDTYDLGSDTLRWQDLYLGPASLHIYCSAAECTSARDWSLGVIETAGASQGNLRLGLAGANNLIVDTSGNLGVGRLTLASTRLAIEYDVATQSSGLLIQASDTPFDRGANIASDAAGNAYFGTNTGDRRSNFASVFGLSEAYVSTLASDEVILGTNGTDRLTVTTGGNVGIGIADPDEKVEVLGSGTGSTRIGAPAGCGGAGNWGGIGFAAFDGGCTNYNIVGGDGNLWINRDLGGDIYFREDGSSAGYNQLTVQNGGNILIGTSNTAGTLLVVDTKTTAGDPAGVNGGMYYNSSTGTFRCYQAGAWTNCVGGSSLSGSGASNQVAYWNGASSLTSSSNFTYNGSSMVLTNSSAASANTFNIFANNATNTNNLINLRNYGGELLVLQPYDAVDRAAISVRNSAGAYLAEWRATGEFRGRDSGIGYSFLSDSDTGLARIGANELALYTANTNRFYVDASGNVGIGDTSLLNKLEVAGVIAGQSVAAAGDVLLVGNDSKLVDINVANTSAIYGIQNNALATLQLGSGSAARLSGDADGLAVGTINPGANFEVRGTFKTATSGDGQHTWLPYSNGYNYLSANITYFRSAAYTAYGQFDSSGLTLNLGEVYTPTVRIPDSPTNTVMVCYEFAPGSTIRMRRCASSSQQYKHDIQTYTGGLDKVRQLRPVTFLYNQGYSTDTSTQIGFIAEEIAAIDPLFAVYKDGQVETVRYDRITALNSNAIVELDLQIQSNTTRLNTAEATLAVLNSTTTNLIKRNLTVTNRTTTLNLTVTGTATIANLKVTGTTELADLKVDRIITKGNTPTAVLAATTTGQGSTYTIEGNDTAGTITYTSGTNTVLNPLASGEQITVMFDKPFDTQPRIALTAKDLDSATVRTFVETTVNGFVINFLDTPAQSTEYNFDYIIIQ